MGLKNNKEKNSNTLSYTEFFTFALSLFDGDIAMASIYARDAYNKQQREIYIDEMNSLLDEDYEEEIEEGRNIEDRLYLQNKKLKYGEVCFTLSAGRYTVGMDIPEGRYRITAKKKILATSIISMISLIKN